MAEHKNRRFTIEEIDNGWLMKTTTLESDKLVGRSAYLSLDDLVAALRQFLSGSKD